MCSVDSRAPDTPLHGDAQRSHHALEPRRQRPRAADENPDDGYVGPQTLGGAGVSLMLYVPDVDAMFARAVKAGAKVRRDVADQFYGDRVGTLIDPFGHVWSIGTHREDVSVEEAKRRMEALMKQG